MADDKAQAALEKYRQKRSADQTGEPFGGQGVVQPQVFVIHKHDATRLHYDIRLEWGGVLWSWACPKGPSLDPDEKRLAVKVEEHPVEYADFEGVIPKGNYGAGPIIVWDRGQWVPFDDPDQAMADGMLHFELHGYKLRGIWTLVQIKTDPKNWLLIKKADGWHKAGESEFDEGSVLSGLTVEELKAGPARAAEVTTELVKLGATNKQLKSREVRTMLAETAEAPFSRQGWYFEMKYDGFRLLAECGAKQIRLKYRSGRDATAVYPDLVKALNSFPYEHMILDGEVVVLDEEGKPDFQRLQRRAQLQRPRDIQRSTVGLPVTYFVFDLLGFGDHDLRDLPLADRKRLLQKLVAATGPVRFADHVPDQGEALFELIKQRGLEGVMAKDSQSKYQGRRSPSWMKVVLERNADFVIIGWTEPDGSRVGFRSLHLAFYEGDELTYAGRVGSGFNDGELRDLSERFEKIERPEPCCELIPPTHRRNRWVEPELVCEVKYKTWTDSGNLRHPVFVRLRDDKQPSDCTVTRARIAPPEVQVVAEAVPKEVKFTRPEKVFWPEEGYTKGDLIAFYDAVSDWLLPYLKSRPLVMTRYPDGIDGKSFFQKDAPPFLPDWIRTQTMWSEHAEREIRYIICENRETLVYLANLGTIPLHIWASRVDSLQNPDWTIIDLDPKEAPFIDVVRLALAVKALCDEISLPCYPKTSGSSGMHILIPLGGQCTYQQARQLAHLISQIVVEEHAEIGTLNRRLSERSGKVYFDWLQNGHGRLLVSPFCVRPRQGATVSTPLLWDEVVEELDPDRFTIQSVPERLSEMALDPMSAVITEVPNLLEALASLAARLGALED